MPDMVFIFVSACFVIALVCLFLYLKREYFDPEGKGAAKAAAGILKRYALLRRFKVLSDARLGGDGELIIENMLIGYFGILLVRTLGVKGDYYGTLSGEKWSVVCKDKKTPVDNPKLALDKEAAALRALLSRRKLYNVPIECVVYIANKSRSTTVSITHNGEIIAPGKLSSYLGKTKFEKDLGLDVEKIAQAAGEAG